MKVKVFGGLHSGRMLELPDTAREGDYITLPRDLPPGEMFMAGRSNPNLHERAVSYQLRESVVGDRPKYLSTVFCDTPRFILSVTVPPVPAASTTITL